MQTCVDFGAKYGKFDITQAPGAYLEGGPRGPRPPQSKFFGLRLSIA